MKKLAAFIFAVYLCAITAFADETAVNVASSGTRGNQVGAGAAIVMETMTGRVLFSQNADDRLPMASTTKILTALIALEQPDIDAVFQVDSLAILVEGSSMGLQKGDKASLRTLAAGMLLASGNDAANAAAVRVAGSVPGFVAMMNERARAMGLSNTSFETPSGLDGESHYSSARDMAEITRAALSNDDFAAICAQYKMRTSFGNPPYDRWLTNHNKLLNYYEGTIGVKTGFTKKAGRCLVSAARSDGVTLLCVTLNCPNDWNVHEGLYNRCFGELQIEDLSALLPELRVPVTGGAAKSVGAVKYDIAQVPVPVSGAEIRLDITLEPFLYAPVRKGRYVGEARIFLDGMQVGNLTLTAESDIPLLYEYKEKKSFGEWIRGLFDKL